MFNTLNATWMNNHYDWNNQQFKGRVAGSLNLAANYVANVLHTLWLDAGQPILEYPQTMIVMIVAVAPIFVLEREPLLESIGMIENSD